VPTRLRKVVFLWENFGPMHIDRLNALAHATADEWQVVGVQWTGKSTTYEWVSPDAKNFSLVTLFPDTAPGSIGFVRKLWRTLSFCLKSKSDTFFFSHYNDAAIIITSMILALLGKRVFCMLLSKFDDYDRKIRLEVFKSLILLPYAGFLTNRGRSEDYIHFLRGRNVPIAYGHNTLSVGEIRSLAGAPPAPGGLPHAARHFTAVSRLVPKKNLGVLVDAYALYKKAVVSPRPLHICGSGELEAELRAKIVAHSLEDFVILRGFQQRPEIAQELAQSLALILPSIEEQFGNVIIEAQAMGVPTLISYNCGALETLVRSGVNGFVVEPDNPAGLAFFMQWLQEDTDLWERLALGCAQFLPRADTPAFVEGVMKLL
jgi:glycosyltransferase involved in cell wall biosynthesis